MKRVAVIFTLLLMMVVVLPVGAAGEFNLFDRIIRTGETVKEDIAVHGGNLIVEAGAIVDGDVVVLGGAATIDGQINGDVAVFGGNVTLSGIISGDLVVTGGNLTIDDSGDVDGDCLLVGGGLFGDGSSAVSCSAFGQGLPRPEWLSAFVAPPPSPDPPAPLPVPERPVYRGPSIFERFFGTVTLAAGRSLLLGLLALLGAALVPNQLNQVGSALRNKPAASGVVGLLTAVAGPSLLALLLLLSVVLTIVCIGLLGYPLVMVLSVMLAAAALMGWIAVGNLVGQRLAEALSLKNRSLPVTAALGTAVLTLVSSLLSALPFWLGGWAWAIAAFAVGCAGLGAVALTKFGTRAYPVMASNGDKVAAILETLPDRDSDTEPPK
jgi:hypothetical protein